MQVNGHIISGVFDEQLNEFSLQQVKYFPIESILKENQLQAIKDYLKKHRNDPEGQIITLYDQLPLHLTEQEIELVISDLENVQSLYQS